MAERFISTVLDRVESTSSHVHMSKYSMPKVQLLFDDNFVYAGEALNGFIKVSVQQPHELRDVYLLLSGTQEVRLTETLKYTKSHTAPVHYYDAQLRSYRTQQHFFTTEHDKVVQHEHKLTLLNEQVLVKNGPEILQPGDSYIPFSVQLPQNLPAIHGKVELNLRQSGYNSYVAQASLRLNHTLFTAKSQVTVHQRPPRPVAPIRLGGVKPLGTVCCFWEAGSMEIRTAVGKNTFMAGEPISIDLLVNCEKSIVDSNDSYIRLMEYSKYASGTYEHSTSRCLSRIEIPAVEKGSRFESSFLLPVPETFALATSSSGIQVHHGIEFCIKAGWSDSDFLTAPMQLCLPNQTVDRTSIPSPVSIAADQVFKLQ